MKTEAVLVFAIWICVTDAAWGQPGPVNPANGAQVFQQPPAAAPWNNDVIVFRADPKTGAAERMASFHRAGVPTIARMNDGRLVVAHQHFPENDQASFDKIAVHFSKDEGKSWTPPQVIRFEGLPAGMRFPFDPTVVPLPDGQVRLYFTGNMTRAFGPSIPAIHSAISTDAIHYKYEPGVRFAIEGRIVIDCAVAILDGVFHLYSPDNGEQTNLRFGPPGDSAQDGVVYHAISDDGLNFQRVADVTINGRRQWLGNVLSDGNELQFFGTGEGFSDPAEQTRRSGIWMAVSSDGDRWQLVPGPQVGVADPGVVESQDGSWIVVGTSPPVRR